MALYRLFSTQVEIQYKSYLLSKATFFTLITTLLNIILPFIIAYRSRGFWLKSHSFFEQPLVHFTYEYLLTAETQDPSQSIICSGIQGLDENEVGDRDKCVTIEVEEHDFDDDGKSDSLQLKFQLDVPPDKILVSFILILGLNFQLKTVCPMHMQNLAVVSKDFVSAPSSYNYYGDLQLYQTSHLPCFFGNTEMQFRYTPSILQEIKWAWPQYLSIVVIFYWLFNKAKTFVFRRRMFMAWEIIPWKISK
ncbi:transmembrane protein 231-like [Manduca sexta]|uniref:transmembrane protein 231-like n=1 Tax=Manduca sexta TaxID=7130 RepID=UPI00188F1DB1|nr:transmembrane protein 231-like [Manduca sexta]